MTNTARIAALIIATLTSLVALVPAASASVPKDAGYPPSLPNAPWADLEIDTKTESTESWKARTQAIRKFELSSDMSDEQTFVEAEKLRMLANLAQMALDEEGKDMEPKKRLALQNIITAAGQKETELQNIWRNHDLENRGPGSWETALAEWIANGRPMPFDPRQLPQGDKK